MISTANITLPINFFVALQGPLKYVFASPSSEVGYDKSGLKSMAAVHWQSAGHGSETGCNALVTCSNSGKIHANLVIGHICPAWVDDAPQTWRDDYDNIIAIRHHVSVFFSCPIVSCQLVQVLFLYAAGFHVYL